MSNRNSTSSGGLGLASVLSIVFIVLKLVGVITWRWLWVLSPIWISFILFLLVFAGYTIAIYISDRKYR